MGCGGTRLTPFDDTWLRGYRRRHPDLFKHEQTPAPGPDAGAGLPRSASNGYASEALFQAAAVEALILLGWQVHESYLGSDGGGGAWLTPGFPDLMVYREGRRLWFAELKQPGRKPTDVQLAYHARLRAAGFRVVVAWTLAGVLTIEEEERT